MWPIKDLSGPRRRLVERQPIRPLERKFIMFRKIWTATVGFRSPSMHQEADNVTNHTQRRLHRQVLAGVLLAASLLGTASTLPSNAAPPAGQVPVMPPRGTTGTWVAALRAAPVNDGSTLGIACSGLQQDAERLAGEYKNASPQRRAQILDDLRVIGGKWNTTCREHFGDILIAPASTPRLPESRLIASPLVRDALLRR